MKKGWKGIHMTQVLFNLLKHAVSVLEYLLQDWQQNTKKIHWRCTDLALAHPLHPIAHPASTSSIFASHWQRPRSRSIANQREELLQMHWHFLPKAITINNQANQLVFWCFLDRLYVSQILSSFPVRCQEMPRAPKRGGPTWSKARCLRACNSCQVPSWPLGLASRTHFGGQPRTAWEINTLWTFLKMKFIKRPYNVHTVSRCVIVDANMCSPKRSGSSTVIVV